MRSRPMTRRFLSAKVRTTICGSAWATMSSSTAVALNAGRGASGAGAALAAGSAAGVVDATGVVSTGFFASPSVKNHTAPVTIANPAIPAASHSPALLAGGGATTGAAGGGASTTVAPAHWDGRAIHVATSHSTPQTYVTVR